MTLIKDRVADVAINEVVNSFDEAVADIADQATILIDTLGRTKITRIY